LILLYFCIMFFFSKLAPNWW